MSDESAVTGPQKVAAFLLALDKETSARVMRSLDPKVVADVAEAMTELDPSVCSAEAVDGLFSELARTVFRRTGVRPQDTFELHEILENTYGADEATRVIGDIHERRRQERPFEFVEKFPSDSVVRALERESNAIIALVLSHVAPEMSAQVLSALDTADALEVVQRMTTISPPGIETLLTIAEELQLTLKRVAGTAPPRDREDSIKTVADLLNFTDTEIEQGVLEGLERQDADTVAEIREFMFTWDDLASIEKRAMQKILASVDTRTLAMALKACPEAVEENIMSNLSQRVREMVADERELAGPVPLAEVHAARAEIMVSVRGLLEAGEFSLTKSGEELVS